MHKSVLPKLLLIVRKEWLIALSLTLCLLLASCNTQIGSGSIKAAQQVTPVYMASSNPNFYFHQDTLYLGNIQFMGYAYQLYSTGDTEYVKGFVNGLEEGVQKSWHANKQLAELRFYKSGKKQGPQNSWWPNGKQRFAYTAIDDFYSGELKEWDVKGMLYRDFNYVNGQEEGSEKMWWPDGSVRANYFVHNGKRYGLLGMKLCANPIDSIRTVK